MALHECAIKTQRDRGVRARAHAPTRKCAQITCEMNGCDSCGVQMTDGMQRTVGAIPCRPQLERMDKSGGLTEKGGGHTADGSATEVLIMHDGLFWLSVKSVTVWPMDYKWLFPCQLS